ncbi:MAG: universal stress protein [Deltaproteobacteria bacterium]|nr:universal stress protein [Deltaproteobacteria bacterium]
MKRLVINKVLIPVDFTDCSRRAFYVALELAAKFGAKCTVMHVIEPITALDLSAKKYKQVYKDVTRMEEGVQKRVEEFVAEEDYEIDPASIGIEISVGKPFQEILKKARELGVDLVIMGSHGKLAGDEVMMGSTAERVVRRAPCPVLVIKPQDFRFEIPNGLKK